jgi:predicted CoA-substrate-specific enzyme activase
MFCTGIDVGSRAIKIVVLDTERRAVAASGVADQGVRQAQLVEELYANLLKDAGISRDSISRVVATGYGRHALGFADEIVTEIRCHAVGTRFHLPDVRTVIDIGGQDSKLIRLDERGNVRDFSMNDRCAAGTGCFLEVVARRLGLAPDELGEAVRRSATPSAISSMCVVFAETEIVSLLAEGAPAEDIVAGVQKAVAERVSTMAGRAVEGPVAFTGGVALVPGMAEALEGVLGTPVAVPPEPQMTGALGAALVAVQNVNSCNEAG